MESMVPEQMYLSRELPVVIGNVDYEEFAWRLVDIDRLLRTSRLENDFIKKALLRWEQEGRTRAKKEGRKYREPGAKDLARMQGIFREALRRNIARLLTEKE